MFLSERNCHRKQHDNVILLIHTCRHGETCCQLSPNFVRSKVVSFEQTWLPALPHVMLAWNNHSVQATDERLPRIISATSVSAGIERYFTFFFCVFYHTNESLSSLDPNKEEPTQASQNSLGADRSDREDIRCELEQQGAQLLPPSPPSLSVG